MLALTQLAPTPLLPHCLLKFAKKRKITNHEIHFPFQIFFQSTLGFLLLQTHYLLIKKLKWLIRLHIIAKMHNEATTMSHSGNKALNMIIVFNVFLCKKVLAFSDHDIPAPQPYPSSLEMPHRYLTIFRFGIR